MRLMIINAGWEQTDLIRKAKELGHYVIATDASKDAPGFAYADETFVIEPRDIVSHLELAKEKNIDGITADQCDYSYYTATYIADVLDLPGAGLMAAQNCTNKKWMREACKSAGIKQPEYQVCKYLNEAYRAVKDIGLPAIIKPVDNRGGFGVTKIERPDQAESAFYEAIANAHSRECLVEEYIEGTMTTVDGFAFGRHSTLVTASKKMLGGRKQVAMEVDYPAIYDLSDINDKTVGALGITFGATHAEYIVNDDGVYFIECANRGGGCYTSSRIVPAVSGFDISEGLIRAALGETVSVKKSKGSAVVLRFFQLPPGRVKKIDVIDLENVLAFQMLYKEGDIVEPITNSANRHGFIIAKGETVEKALQIVEQARGCIE